MAGSLRISGEVRNCDLTASGDIEVGRVVGGTLTAGGSITADTAGDRDGTTTELWAGHQLTYGQQAELAKLSEERHQAERSRLVADCKAIEDELADAQRRNERVGRAGFVRKDAVDKLTNRLASLEQNRRAASDAAEAARLQLAQQRKVSRELQALGDDARAGVRIKIVAHEGVVARLANVEPEVLSSPRLQYQLGVNG
ncbi:MAG TPA: FapA family protein [Acetobacteraceae bacterium]|nr:FapA family protein [Acetobacteraceae bacterium]